MKASLELKIGQRLSMTPQLQQAIRLLQMSTLDLATEIQQALETNPMLEEFEPSNESQDVEPSGVDRDESFDTRTSAADAGANSDEQINSASLNSENPLDYEAQYDPPTAPVQRTGDGDAFELDARNESPTTLTDYLFEQIAALHLTNIDRYIAEVIVTCIDDAGYLVSSVDEVRDIVNHELGLNAGDGALAIDTDVVNVVLKHVQNLDPIGVGARNLSECLLLQLRSQEPDEHLEHARAIVMHHLETLAARDFESVRKALGADAQALRGALEIVQRLDARPGTQVSAGVADYVIPDVIVRRGSEAWVASLNSQNMPNVRVNDSYASLIKRGNPKEDNAFLKGHLNEARFFLKSLHNRHETLLRVAREIVTRQQSFFEEGDEAMKPMVLADIATALELHESTISRATTQKYMLTPRGVYELKYFFSSGIANATGDAHSATAIRSMIKKLIEAEPAAKPISDSKIANTLGGQGVKVARRTVAKYREAMNIPPSNLRKEMH